MRSLPSKYEKNVVTFCLRDFADGAGLTIEETIEFEALDALPPFDDCGNIAWVFEGEPTTRREKRWLELYFKKGSGTGPFSHTATQKGPLAFRERDY
jgi:hypothetical protein